MFSKALVRVWAFLLAWDSFFLGYSLVHHQWHLIVVWVVLVVWAAWALNANLNKGHT